MGYLLLAGGTAHLVAVNVTYLANGFPTHDRAGYIYFIGVIQLVTGYLDLLTHRTVTSSNDLPKRLTKSIVMLSALTISAYAIIILPTYPSFSPLFKLAPPLYLIYHWWVVFKVCNQLKAGNKPL